MDVASLASHCTRRDNRGFRFAQAPTSPMPKVAAPIKTPLGHDEWRSRALGLGQRHRTMLFLVDGKRPLSEVLSLALQAGARTSHFEDLVRLGLVELDIDSEWPADASPSRSGGLDSSGLSTRAGALSVEIASRLPTPTSAGSLDSAAVPLDSRSEARELEPVTAARTPHVDALEAVHAAPASSSPRATLRAAPEPARRIVAARSASVGAGLPQHHGDGSRVASAAGARRQPAAARAEFSAPRKPAPLMRTMLAGQAIAGSVDVGAGALTVSRPRLSEATEELVSQVRDLLLDTMRADAPLFAAITVVRVRRAQTRKDLIDVVWAIERHLGISRRKRREMPSLQQARELLGMGNTQITIDTQSFPETE
jgi:hypothetical protein